MNKPTCYTVLAGKWDGDEINWKYIEDFNTFEDALEAYDKVCDYPEHRLEDANGSVIRPNYY